MDEREIKIIATADTRKAVENLNLFSERVQTIRKNLKKMGETAVKAGKDAERSMEKISQSAEKGLSAEEKRKASRGFGDAGKQGREKISEIYKKLPKKYKRIFKNKGIMNEEGKGIGGDLFKNMTSGVLASLTAGRVLASGLNLFFPRHRIGGQEPLGSMSIKFQRE